MTTLQAIASVVGAVVVSIVAGMIVASVYQVVKEQDRKHRAWNDHLFGSR